MIKPSISPKANTNYLAKIFLLKKIEKCPNSDNLYRTEVDFQPVITSKDAELNSWYVYFPTESKISTELLSSTNSYRDKTLNVNSEATPGYFEKSSRVKTIQMRGNYSSGYIVPLKTVEVFMQESIEREEVYFDTLKDKIIVEKYIVPFTRKEQILSQSKSDKKASKINVVEGQFKFHDSTENLRKNSYKIKPLTEIDVTYKYHGTSAIVGNVLFEKPLNTFQKLVNNLIPNYYTPKKYYDYIASSRKVIKVSNSSDPGFYSQDIWSILKEEIKEKIPKGFVVYGEIVGYLPNGGVIQGGYDYGLKPGTHAFYIYRITFVNDFGTTVELSTEQIIEFSKKAGLPYINKFYSGSAVGLYREIMNLGDLSDVKYYNNILENYFNSEIDFKTCKDEDKEVYLELYSEALIEFQNAFVKLLELQFNEKNCYLCKTKVPEEGVVVRLSGKLDKFEALKLKSFKFLKRETDEADKEVSNMEDQN